jgi:hypothetical protein
MKHYSDLGHVFRCEPCIEYPGYWLLFVDGKEAGQYNNFNDCYAATQKSLDIAMQLGVTVSICWQCSEDDPRVGELWFTGFFQYGKFDQFGRYVT